MQWFAEALHRLATRIHNDGHKELVEIKDEYQVCRCRIEVAGDDLHGVDATFVELPPGWEFAISGSRPINVPAGGMRLASRAR